MNNGICKIPLISCLTHALRKLLLTHFLQIMSEISAIVQPSSARSQTISNLPKGSLRRVKAVHAAPSRLKVHYVELFVQKSVELVLACLHAHHGALEHFCVHVLNWLSAFCHFEEVSELLVRLFLRIKVHLRRFLKLPASLSLKLLLRKLAL